MPLSTATPERLLDIETLRRLTKSIAMLDAIICPEWEYRYYSYNSKWGENEEMASMRNGCGDDWFMLFDPHGAALKGFAHEYPFEIPPGAVRAIYEHQPLSDRLIATLNSELALSEIAKDVQEIGYYCEPSSRF